MSFWNDRDIEYLRQNFKDKTLKELSLYLNRDESSINNKAYRLKLKRIYKFKDLNFKGGNLKYTLNHNYFENINSRDKAYFLGLLVADGSVNNKNLVSTFLQEKDKHILETFKNYLNYTGVIKYNKNRTKTSQAQYSLRFISKKICEDLSKYGVVKNKTFITYFPDIPEEFYSNFIRGVFDGDGCIYISQNLRNSLFSITGNKMLLTKIQDVLKEFCLLNNNNKVYEIKSIKGTNSIHTIHFGGRKQIKRIYDYLYKDSGDLFLKRKKEKFEKLF